MRSSLQAVDGEPGGEFRFGRARAVEVALNGIHGFSEGRVGHSHETIVAEDSARGIEATPAGSGQINLGPSMHFGRQRIGESRVRRFMKIATDETGGDAEVPAESDQQHGIVAARAPAAGDGFGGRLNANFMAAPVGEGGVNGGVERTEKRNRFPGRRRQVGGEPGLKLPGIGSRRQRETRAEGEGVGGIVGEGEFDRPGFEEEIERVGVEGLDEKFGAKFEMIRAGFGIEIDPVEGVVLGVVGGDAPARRRDGQVELMQALALRRSEE